MTRYTRLAPLPLIAALIPGCATAPLATPARCTGTMALLAGIAGVATSAERASDHDNADSAMIGLGILLAGAGAGYLLCKALKPADPGKTVLVGSEPATAAPAPSPSPAMVAAGSPVSAPAPAPEPDPCDRLVGLESVHFDFDQAEIDPNASVLLDRLAEALDTCSETRLRIDGYTDSIGTPLYNTGLSEKRANAVKQFLIQHGIAADRLSTKGFGDGAPISPNDTPEGRALNRRVESYPID